MIFDENGKEESIHPTTIIDYVLFYLIWVYFSNLFVAFSCAFLLGRENIKTKKKLYSYLIEMVKRDQFTQLPLLC